MKREDQIHAFLVSQWQAEQEEQKKMVYALSCCGDCAQMHTPCRCPEACLVPIESVESAHPWLWLAYVVALVGTVAASALLR